jgi:hypothetical protein
MMTRVTLFRVLSIFLFILTCTHSNAVEMRHNFTLTGDNGETGSGYFTWDDAIVLDGNSLITANIISGSITINGGTTPGGTQTFDLGGWGITALDVTPDFAVDLNITADNGAETLTPFNPYLANTSWGSIITTAPGSTVLANLPVTPQAIPLLDLPGLIIITLLVVATGLWQLKRFSSIRS